MELNVIYELVHVRQRQNLLKTHLGRNEGQGGGISGQPQAFEKNIRTQLCDAGL